MFYKQAVNSKDGYQAHCKTCDNKRKDVWVRQNPKLAAQHQKVADKNRASNPNRRYRSTIWKKNNPVKVKMADARRRAAKLNRTPKWLDVVDVAEIEFTYEYAAALRSCGLNYHVDHVLPLQGKKVSGLHAPSNLQVVYWKENLRKGNLFEP